MGREGKPVEIIEKDGRQRSNYLSPPVTLLMYIRLTEKKKEYKLYVNLKSMH